MANDEDRWQQAYNNAAERLFGKVEGDTTSADEDEACIEAANAEVKAETSHAPERERLPVEGGPSGCDGRA